MDAKKKKDASSTMEDSAATDAAQMPVKVFRQDDVSVSIFGRERMVQGKPTTFFSTSFSRSYRDVNGKWQYTKSFDVSDLPKLIVVANLANDYIVSQQKEPQPVA